MSSNKYLITYFCAPNISTCVSVLEQVTYLICNICTQCNKPSARMCNHEYSIDDTVLQHAESEKDVRVTIDKLKFRKHKSIKINKPKGIMGIMTLIKFLDDGMVPLLFINKSLVRPHLEYANWYMVSISEKGYCY